MSVHDANRTEFTYGFAIGMLARDPKCPVGLAPILASICVELNLLDKTLPDHAALGAAIAAAKDAQETIIGRPLVPADTEPPRRGFRWPWSRPEGTEP